MESFAIARERFGIDRVEHEKLVLHQRVDHGASALFDGNPHGSAVKPPPELCNPGMQDVRALGEVDLFDRPTAGWL